MTNDFVKRFIKKDGSQRISFYRDEYADNPRYTTDEPLHCEDWSRDYSIMTKDDRERKSSDARKLLEYMLNFYGDHKKIIYHLKCNFKLDKHNDGDCGLAYNQSRKEWVLYSWQGAWKDYRGIVHEPHWEEEDSFIRNPYDLDTCWFTENLSDETIDYLVENCMTDKVKMCSYSFDYYGTVSFYDDVTCESEGIAWLEKDEFLKYSGCDPKTHWEGKSLREIEWLFDELEAWGDGDVYWYEVEEKVVSKIHKEYTNVERESEDYEEVEWECTDSCSGFYGKLDKVREFIYDNSAYNLEDFEEEDV